MEKGEKKVLAKFSKRFDGLGSLICRLEREELKLDSADISLILRSLHATFDSIAWMLTK